MAGESILVVDDNATNTVLVKYLLEVRGYIVQCAEDAQEMAEVLKTFHPSLILMDVQLPGTDGLELTRRLKANPETRHIPVLAVTAYAMTGDREQALAAGCDGYMSKPIDTRVLPVLIAQLIKDSANKL